MTDWKAGPTFYECRFWNLSRTSGGIGFQPVSARFWDRFSYGAGTSPAPLGPRGP